MVKIVPAVVAVALVASSVEATGSKQNWDACEGFGFTAKWPNKTWKNRYYCGKPQGDRDYCFQNGGSASINDFMCDQMVSTFVGKNADASDAPWYKVKAPNGGWVSEITCYKTNGDKIKEILAVDGDGVPTGEIAKYRNGGFMSHKCNAHNKDVFSLAAYPDWNFNGKPRELATVIGRTEGLQEIPTTPRSAAQKIKEWNQCFFDHETYPKFQYNECEDGYHCAKDSQWWSRCMEDPKADHECCHSENEWGCTPGSCCAGMFCLIDDHSSRCARPNSSKGESSEPSTGIAGCTGRSLKTGPKTIYARCYEPTPWSEWDKGVALPQGDCGHGLVCMGDEGLGQKAECHPDPALFDKTKSMDFWETSCRSGDCRQGSFCKQFYRDDGSPSWSQCRWGEEKGCMRKRGTTHAKGCDKDCLEGGDCEPVHDGLVSIPDLARTYEEELGTCVGAICSVWGDPHIVSCDNKKWDCQAEGLFTYMKNDLFDIQTHFVQLDTPMGHSASITQGIVIDNMMVEEAPKVQFMFPPMEYEGETYPSESKKIGNCPVMMHIDDQLMDISGVDTYYYEKDTDMPAPGPGHILFQNDVLKAWRVEYNLIMLEYTVQGTTSTIQIKSGGSGPHTGWSCIFSMFVCLPKDMEDTFKTFGSSTGIAGTPDGDYRNEWITADGTTSLEYGGSKAGFDFCTSEYCVSQTGAKMTFPAGKTYGDYMCKDQEFKQCGLNELKNDMGFTDAKISEECDKPIAEITDEMPCIVELCANGEAFTEEEEEIDEIVANGNPEDPQNPEEPEDDCEDLGTFLSEATGAYALTNPAPVATCEGKSAGRDESTSVLVGKDYHCMQGIGMEGKLVVVDDMIVDAGENACSTFVYTTDGACVHPESDTRCIMVGDSISLGASSEQPIAIMQEGSQSCHTIHGGSCSVGDTACEEAIGSLVATNGEVKQETLDLTAEKTELTIVKQKQAYWATLEANGVAATDGNKMTLTQGPDKLCVQVFDFDSTDFDGIDLLYFDKDLFGKTILINVAGDNPTITMPKMHDGSGYSGVGGAESFEPMMAQSILWNFHGSTNGYVTLSGDIDIQGSMVVAGDMIYKANAHLGRVIVQGNLVQDGPSSVFLNYPFHPKCPLPLPESTADVCEVNPPPVCVETSFIEDTSSDVCPGDADVVTLLKSTGTLPEGEPVIYGLEFIPGDDGSPQVKFKVDNPFVGKSDIYVKYGKKVAGWGTDPACDKKFNVDGCAPNAYDEAEITAGCTVHEGSEPYALVSIYFASKENEFLDAGASLDKCCHGPDYETMYGYEIYEFIYEIKCECPSTISAS
eukprot:CAMPEP_0113453290 /NCGR_PEP_ID=MMETSP0014_2-20120614/7282_1 /TAXON_ID=2857 /ORGANISM="Nitzschia sp." /LENGTH=1307 /DNA_ID=CAMNT_0000344681 /DNA_START=135 /DNA_END=4058 /DNA_ORIENTATION=+ /assembly_acc=CAM_ASM_000159